MELGGFQGPFAGGDDPRSEREMPGAGGVRHLVKVSSNNRKSAQSMVVTKSRAKANQGTNLPGCLQCLSAVSS